MISISSIQVPQPRATDFVAPQRCRETKAATRLEAADNFELAALLRFAPQPAETADEPVPLLALVPVATELPPAPRVVHVLAVDADEEEVSS